MHLLLLEHSGEAWREGLWQADMALGGGACRARVRGSPWGGDSDKRERDKGTHKSSEEGPAPILKIWGDPECPCPVPPGPLCPTPPHPQIKTTFLHGHYLFFVPFSFCKKRSQKPVQNHQCGCCFILQNS